MTRLIARRSVRLSAALLAAACHAALPATEPTEVPAAHAAAEPASAALPAPEPNASAAPAPCPTEMVWVPEKGGFCIDRWEASLVRLEGSPWPSNQPIDRAEPLMAVSVPARLPQGYISGRQAAQACERAEKRLCSLPEWKQACRGPRAQRYPYGNERRAQVCNDRFKILDRHPVARLFKQYAPAGAPASLMWTSAWMNDPRLHELSDSVAETGSFEGCSSDYGVFDMVGNLHEWVADPEGTFAGGFFMDTYQNGEGCDYRTTGHSFDYHDYSTGFRCCKNALEAN